MWFAPFSYAPTCRNWVVLLQRREAETVRRWRDNRTKLPSRRLSDFFGTISGFLPWIFFISQGGKEKFFGLIVWFFRSIVWFFRGNFSFLPGKSKIGRRNYKLEGTSSRASPHRVTRFIGLLDLQGWGSLENLYLCGRFSYESNCTPRSCVTGPLVSSRADALSDTTVWHAPQRLWQSATV